MPEDMNLSINGHSQVPPGFRFHPTEEELLHYYLRKKVACGKIDLDVIREVDLNKLEPWDIQEKCKIGSTPQNDWYFFSHKDKKYPTGTRTNRATAAGFWKATGRDKIIYSGFTRIGLRKTLVFYKGRAPHGQKSDWIMHEYRLDDISNLSEATTNISSSVGDAVPEEGWVVCRVFRKKNYQKPVGSPRGSSSSIGCGSHGVLDQILVYMGRTCKMESESISGGNGMRLSSATNTTGMSEDIFMRLPGLDSATTLPSLPTNSSPSEEDSQMCDDVLRATEKQGPICFDMAQTVDHHHAKSDWVALDRLVASQLNGQVETSRQLSRFALSTDDDQHMQLRPNQANAISHQAYKGDNDLWSFVKLSTPLHSSSDPLCHLAV